MLRALTTCGVSRVACRRKATAVDVKQTAAATTKRILERVTTIAGTKPYSDKTPPKPGAKAEAALGGDAEMERELRHLMKSAETAPRPPSVFSTIPDSFVKNPTIDFAGFRKFGEKFLGRSQYAPQYLELVAAHEASAADGTLPQHTEDAIVNAMVPLEQQLAALAGEAAASASTSRARIAELQREVETVDAQIASLETLDISALEGEHPDWAAVSDSAIEKHDWNLIQGEEDKDAH